MGSLVNIQSPLVVVATCRPVGSAWRDMAPQSPRRDMCWQAPQTSMSRHRAHSTASLLSDSPDGQWRRRPAHCVPVALL